MAITINGKYSTAIIYNDSVEDGSIGQIVQIANHPATKGADIRIMPDVHEGAGICIGFTAQLTNKIVPNWIGVDIGCGVLSYRIGELKTSFSEIDKIIRMRIPFGMRSRNSKYKKLSDIVYMLHREKLIDNDYKGFAKELIDVAKRVKEPQDKVFKALGSLGGGNHFIELNIDNEGAYWLTIHSGSRHFGLTVAKHHQKRAKSYIESKKQHYSSAIRSEVSKYDTKSYDENKITNLRSEYDIYKGIPTVSAFLPINEGGSQYLHDMRVAQEFASINRRVMAEVIIHNAFGLEIRELESVESVHNYINFNDNIIRKGAISAYEGEKVIIPLNMRDGTIIGIGKSNSDWNYSAPHGAGRVYSRSKAKQILQIDEFKRQMKGVWSSCISKKTIDESPMAYKNKNEIVEYLKDTVDIKYIMKPVYNFKAD